MFLGELESLLCPCKCIYNVRRFAYPHFYPHSRWCWYSVQTNITVAHKTLPSSSSPHPLKKENIKQFQLCGKVLKHPAEGTEGFYYFYFSLKKSIQHIKCLKNVMIIFCVLFFLVDSVWYVCERTNIYVLIIIFMILWALQHCFVVWEPLGWKSMRCDDEKRIEPSKWEGNRVQHSGLIMSYGRQSSAPSA